MKIILAADHAGFQLKEKIKEHLIGQGHEVQDMGAFSLDPEDDYPDFVRPAAEAVALRLASASASSLALRATADKQGVFGIVFGGSGQGEAIVANKIKGIRAVVYYGEPLEIVELSRKHNDVNVLSLGARFLTTEQAIEVVNLWLKTPFEGGRHERRIDKIEN